MKRIRLNGTAGYSLAFRAAGQGFMRGQCKRINIKTYCNAYHTNLTGLMLDKLNVSPQPP